MPHARSPAAEVARFARMKATGEVHMRLSDLAGTCLHMANAPGWPLAKRKAWYGLYGSLYTLLPAVEKIRGRI